MKQGKEPQSRPGISCPDCGCRHLFVVYTRPRADKIVRRKECRHCGKRVLTYERLSGR